MLVNNNFLDINVFKKSCASSGQALIYGEESCPYRKITSWLKKNPEFNDAFLVESLGLPFQPDNRTSDNRQIERIHHDETDNKVNSKAALVNLVIENYKRKNELLDIIPTVFIMGLDEAQLDLPFLMNDNPEIRAVIKRAHKLCSDENLNPNIRDIAQKTFIFISLFQNESDKKTLYDFKIVPKPWESPEWEKLQKKQTNTVNESGSNSVNAPWRNELSSIVYNYGKKQLLNLQDFKSKCAPNGQGMIYGFQSSLYAKVTSWLRKQDEFKDVLSGMAVGFSSPQPPILTSDNREIERINHGDKCDTVICKAGLVNLVIENYKRKKENLNVIPTIFIIGRDQNQLDLPELMDRTSTAVTGSEIRRAAKLCFDETIANEIRDVAKETFIFASLYSNDLSQNTLYNLEVIPKPWESPEWEELKNKRKQTPKLSSDSTSADCPWRSELIKLTNKYETRHKK